MKATLILNAILWPALLTSCHGGPPQTEELTQRFTAPGDKTWELTNHRSLTVTPPYPGVILLLLPAVEEDSLSFAKDGIQVTANWRDSDHFHVIGLSHSPHPNRPTSIPLSSGQHAAPIIYGRRSAIALFIPSTALIPGDTSPIIPNIRTRQELSYGSPGSLPLSTPLSFLFNRWILWPNQNWNYRVIPL